MVLTAYFVLSPATGLFCHRRRADTSAQLDTSVGVSGPHDFAVRLELRSSARRQSVHRIPHPTFVTTAKRPSYRGRDGAESAADLGVTATRAACDRLTRRAISAWRLCANCPSGESVSSSFRGDERAPQTRRHTPRKRGIQYAAAPRFDRTCSGILDHPLARMMTAGQQRNDGAAAHRPTS
jgi:hypothetical protein